MTDMLATSEDIELRLRGVIDDPDAEQVEMYLELASGAIAEAIDEDLEWVAALETVPTTLRMLCIEVVARVMLNPAGLESETDTLGAVSHTARFASGGRIELTDAERRTARRTIGSGTFTPVTLATPYSGDEDTDDEILDALP